ncbi:MAG: putative electron transfer flavoprotein FixA [Oscillospiraceae bacterium]
MKILVCFKIVPDEQEISIKSDKTLDVSRASFVISTYDCNAIEAAMRCAAAAENSSVVALTAGGERVENSKMKKGALSRGPEALFAVKDEALDPADSIGGASALKAGIEKIGGVDLVICGEGSGDMYNQQIGNVLGALMGVPAVNAVSGIIPGDGSVVVERAVEDGVEVLELALPAVLSVASDICPVRIPSMKDILGAGKKPSAIFALDELGGKVDGKIDTVSILAPQDTERKRIVVKGDGDDQLAEFYANIRQAIS